MIDFHKKNKILIKEQRILKADARPINNVLSFRCNIPNKWAHEMELAKDDRDMLVTLTTDKEIIIRKARPEDY